MVELLNDVLIIGRAQAGQLRFKPERVGLEAFCRRIIVEIETSIGGGYEFDFSVSGTSETRWLDPKLLRHVLYNLLSNAVKYSSPNSVVTFELIYEHDQTVLRITDEGIGIPEADLPRLVETFHRAGNVGVRSGTGLGLAIVKQSVDLHGGTITCDTQEGVGTTFTVTLPIATHEVYAERNAYETHLGH